MLCFPRGRVEADVLHLSFYLQECEQILDLQFKSVLCGLAAKHAIMTAHENDAHRTSQSASFVVLQNLQRV